MHCSITFHIFEPSDPDTTIKILRPQIITVEGRLGNNGRAPAGGHGGSSGRHHARSNSGSYNVRASEMAREKQERRMRCLVEFLDNSEEIFEVEVRNNNNNNTNDNKNNNMVIFIQGSLISINTPS